MRHRSPLALACTLALAVASSLCTQALSAQDPAAPQPPAAPAQQPPQRDLVRRDFDALGAYLSKKGSLTSDDRAAVDALAGRARSLLATGDDPLLWAILAQLGTWTDDAALQDEAYARLLKLQSTNEVAMAQWIAALNRRAQFDRAMDETTARFPSLTNFPRVQFALAESLVAQNRFADARAMLEGITSPPGDLGFRSAQLLDRVRRLEALWAEEEKARAEDESKATNPRVEITTPKGPIVIELFEAQAPESTKAFVELTESGAYDGTRFHRRVPGIAVLGGDPNSKEGAAGQVGWGTVGWRVADEAAAPGRRAAFAGTVGLCKAIDPRSPGAYVPNSAGAQFFLLLAPAETINEPPASFTTIGRILDGLDVAAALEPGDELTSARVIRKGDREYKATRSAELPMAVEMSLPSPSARTAPRGSITPVQGNPPIVPALPPR